MLTASDAHNVYLSGAISDVRVMRFADATAYEILWADGGRGDRRARRGSGEAGDEEASDA